VAGRLTRTFLDSGVLIAAYNARPELKAPALAILKDPNRIFLSSPFARHEVYPKSLFNKRHLECRFYPRILSTRSHIQQLETDFGACRPGVG
jgi:hypothetical protein